MKKKLLIRIVLTCLFLLGFVNLTYGYYPVSPYAYCSNNPVKYVDPDGKTIRVYDYINDQRIDYDWKQYEGNWGFYDNNNAIYAGKNAFIGQLSGALTGLMTGGKVGYELVSNLVGMQEVITIGTNMQGTNQYYPQSLSVSWNPNGGAGVPTLNGADTNIPFVSLGHELGHAWDYTQETASEKVWISGETYETKNILNSEIYSTHTENLIRVENGLQPRTHYLIDHNGKGVGPRIIDTKGRSIYYNSSNTTNYRRVSPKNRFMY